MPRKQLTVELEEEQIRAVKIKALETEVSVREVVERLLALYLSGKINVARREG